MDKVSIMKVYIFMYVPLGKGRYLRYKIIISVYLDKNFHAARQANGLFP